MDAAIRSVVVGGLQVGVVYRVEVAASTSAGVGVKSEPQSIIIGKTYRLDSKSHDLTESVLPCLDQNQSQTLKQPMLAYKKAKTKHTHIFSYKVISAQESTKYCHSTVRSGKYVKAVTVSGVV